MYYIQKTFTEIATKASDKIGERPCRSTGESSCILPKVQKTKESSSQSLLTASSSRSNISSDITDSWGSVSSFMSQSELSKAEPREPWLTSTPKQTTVSDSKSPDADSAIKYCITHYAKESKWQIWLDGTPHTVTCTSAKTVSCLSNVFYGMRCIFSHGTPEETIYFGVMRADRTPNSPSDLNIAVIYDQSKTPAECVTTADRCKRYLVNVAKDAKNKIIQMDYNLFLTAQSFYTYAAGIIGSVAACVAYKYGDVKLSEKATHAFMQEIQEIKKTVHDAWSEKTDIEKGITELAPKASDKTGKRPCRRKEKSSGISAKVQKTEKPSSQSLLTASSSLSNISSDITDSGGSVSSLMSSSELSKAEIDMDTSYNPSVPQTEQTTASASTGLTQDLDDISLQ